MKTLKNKKISFPLRGLNARKKWLIAGSLFMALLLIIWGYSVTGGDPVVASGNISVTVKYKGTPPAPVPLKTKKAKSLCGVDNIPNETLILGTGNTIKNTMVYVKGAAGTVVPKDYTLNNQDCIFKPHVGFAAKGSKLIMTNEDAVLHNTHAYFVVGTMKKTILNTALPKGTKPISNTRALSRSGRIMIQCDAHEWMSANIIVVDNPYFAISDKNGKAEIKNVPVGEYDLAIFHETLGEQTKKVKIEAGKTVQVVIEMSK